MKRIFGLVLAIAMTLSVSASVHAADLTKLDEEGFQNEEGCSTEFVCFEADGNVYHYPASECINGNVEETTPSEPLVLAMDEEEFFRAIAALDGDFRNEEGCSSEIVCVEADGNGEQAGEYTNGNARETKAPTTFYNIAMNGIYKGGFYNLRGTIYTNSYFDTKDGVYYSRVRCYGDYPKLKYKVGNYCISCKKILSISEEYTTPDETWQEGEWVNTRNTVPDSHAGHFMCPFVQNTSGYINDELYAIGGDIWVNYTNSWK